ncbi:NAD(P)H-dependent oxidoreductase [uncultured Bilophila sp.]|uniref:NAD(P)H-dependent oxidoreductase n=1 Tax=uncultured Bilophila sp. TaxID=529385 RepID=UPI0026241FAD|nr:NAD(P)H-dependent oxidoreductase [uncultured Bilophila sp.]
MLISLIAAHPYKESFNAALAATVAAVLKGNGHTVRFHDLYQEGFDPILPGEELVSDATQDSLVAVHQEEIREAEGIVIVHPNWWGQPPALMKGWVDRVLREGVAYAFPQGDNGGGLPIGLLKPLWCLIRPTPRKNGNGRSLAIRLSGFGRTVFSLFAVSMFVNGRCSG